MTCMWCVGRAYTSVAMDTCTLALSSGFAREKRGSVKTPLWLFAFLALVAWSVLLLYVLHSTRDTTHTDFAHHINSLSFLNFVYMSLNRMCTHASSTWKEQGVLWESHDSLNRSQHDLCIALKHHPCKVGVVAWLTVSHDQQLA